MSRRDSCGIERADDHQDGRAEQGDRRGLHADHGMEQEADERQAEHGQGPDHQRSVGDRGRRVQRSRARRAGPRRRAIERPNNIHSIARKTDHDHDDDRRQVDQEVGEVESGRRADEDVRRIADERRGAADVRREDLADQVREGRDLQRPRDRQRDRRQQDDRRHVVEDGRQQRRRDREDDEQPERLAARAMDGQPGDVLEEAGPAESAGQDHHPGQQEDDVEVDAGEGLFLVDDAEDDDQQAAEQGDEGPIEALGCDQGVGDDEDAAGEQDVHVRTPAGARCPG